MNVFGNLVCILSLLVYKVIIKFSSDILFSLDANYIQFTILLFFFPITY